MTVHAPRTTASALDILSFRFRDTMYPSLRSYFGNDDDFREFLLQFGGLKFMIPPQSEQERADLCAEALRLLSALDYATTTKRHVDAAEADSALDALRRKWDYPGGAPWTSFLKRLQESEVEISEHVRSCKKALGET